MILDRTVPPAILPTPEFSLQKPERLQMPNGTRLIVVDGGEAAVFRLDVVVQGGSWRQTMPLQSSYTNRMLIEGTRDYSSSQIFDMLDRHGAWMVQNSTVNFCMLTLFSLNKYAKETLKVLESLLKHPVFPQKEFQVLVDSGRQSYLVNSQKVENRAKQSFRRALLGSEHPCARFAQIDDYARIQTSHLKDFYVRHYHSANTAIYLSGHITPAIRKLVEATFGSRIWGQDSALVPLIPIPPVTDSCKQFFLEDEQSLQSAVQMGCLTIPVTHPDYNELKVVETLFGGFFGSRLMRNIREEKGFTYGIGSGLLPIPNACMKVIKTQCAHEYVRPLIDEVYREMEILRNQPIPDEELDMVKNYMMGELSRQYEDVMSLNDAYISADSIGLPDDFMAQATAAIRRLTPERAQEIARRYFDPDQMKEVVVGKKI